MLWNSFCTQTNIVYLRIYTHVNHYLGEWITLILTYYKAFRIIPTDERLFCLQNCFNWLFRGKMFLVHLSDKILGKKKLELKKFLLAKENSFMWKLHSNCNVWFRRENRREQFSGKDLQQIPVSTAWPLRTWPRVKACS